MTAPQPASASRRKQLGQWYTPEALVDHVVAMAVDGVRTGRGRMTVVDPACGDGRFLAAAGAALAQRGVGARLIGVDLDAAAVAAARSALPAAEIHHADALAVDWTHLLGERRCGDGDGSPRWTGVDLVIGNPPYLNQMTTATRRDGPSRFGGGPYADTAADFLGFAVRLVRPDGGRVALVLPQSLLSARDADPIRREVTEHSALVAFWRSTKRMFDAYVHTCAVVIERGAIQQPVARWAGPDFEPWPAVMPNGSWASLLVEESGLDPSRVDGTVGDRMRFSLNFRDEYYGLVGTVGEDRDGVVGPPLITCGLIDPGVCHWGVRSMRFAKQRYDAPRVDLDRLDAAMRRWADALLVPKLLVANQTKRIEVVVDTDGEWLPGVPVISGILRDDADVSLDDVAAVLSSPASTAWVRHHAAGSGLSPTSLRLSPALLARIPWPAR